MSAALPDPMTLPDVLEALAARLPDRVRADHLKAPDEPLILSYLVRVGDDWKRVWERKLINWHGAYGPWWLEMACREEIAARGWAWDTGRGFEGCFASVGNRARWESTGENEMYEIASADTPAEALARALLAALEAQ